MKNFIKGLKEVKGAKTITEIMNDYRATKKMSQADFKTIRNCKSFSTNELDNIMLGLPVGTK